MNTPLVKFSEMVPPDVLATMNQDTKDENSLPQSLPSSPSPTPPGEEGRFFKSRPFDAQYTLQQEQPHHRVICHLAAQGFNNLEIAQQTGYTPVTIAYVKKQPWAEALIRHLIDTEGGEAVRKTLQGSTLTAAKVLQEILEGKEENAKVSDKIKAAQLVLDRVYGTAPQTIVHGKVDLEKLPDSELQKIIAQSVTQSGM